MTHRFNKRAKSAFAPAALGLTLLFSGCASMGNIFGPSNDNNKNKGDNKNVVSSAAWNALTRSYADPYHYGQKPDSTRQKSPVKALQIETSFADGQGLILSPFYPPYTILSRHGESAADIMDRTADGLSGKDVDVRFIEEPTRLKKWFMDPTSTLAKSIFNTADVVTLSMGAKARGDQKSAYSMGTINTKPEIAAADALAQKSDAILVMSAGNSGRDSRIDLERQSADPFVRFDTKVLVGEANRDYRGVYIEAHSSRSSPSFVTLNPYFHGYEYPYFRKQELRSRINKVYNSTPDGSNKPAKEIFKTALEILADTARPSPFGPRPPKTCHPDFKNASFPGKEILEKPARWQANNPDKVRKAMTGCLESASDFMTKRMGGDRDGNISELHGTSFSAPYAGGLFAAMKDKYPDLSPSDLVGAALLASEPVDRVKRSIRTRIGYITRFETVRYRDNGRGLSFNNREAGFGYLDTEKFDRVAKRLTEIAERGPLKQSREVRASSGTAQYDSTHATPSKYTLDVSHDIMALRTNLMLKFKGDADNVPDKITLINPAGGKIEMSPTRMRGNAGYSLASSNGHFGNYTQGTWTIVVPSGVKLESAKLDIAGVTRASLLDKYIRIHGDDLPAKNANYKSANAVFTPTVNPLPSISPARTDATQTAPRPRQVAPMPAIDPR